MMASAGVYRAIATTLSITASPPLAAVLGSAYADMADTETLTADHSISVRRRSLRTWRVSLDGVLMDGVDTASSALVAVRHAVNNLASAAAADDCTVLSAAAVDIDGLAVAIVGPGSAGKTTIALAMAHRGHGYVADDVVAVDSDGLVAPFPRPASVRAAEAWRLGLRVPRGPFEREYPVPVGGWARLAGPAPLRLIALVTRSSHDTGLRPCRPADALMRLANQSLRVPHLQREMFRRTDALVRRVPVVSLHHHDPDLAVRLLEGELRAVAGV